MGTGAGGRGHSQGPLDQRTTVADVSVSSAFIPNMDRRVHCIVVTASKRLVDPLVELSNLVVVMKGTLMPVSRQTATVMYRM